MIGSFLGKGAVVVSLSTLVTPVTPQAARATQAVQRAHALDERGARVEFLGYLARWYNDPDCPYSPDSHEILAAYGYDGSGGIVITSAYPVGMAAYNCANGPKGSWVPDGPYLWHDGHVDPYWGWTNYFPYGWEAGDCWGGGQPC